MFRKMILSAACSLVAPIPLLGFMECGEVTLEGEWIYFRPSANGIVLNSEEGVLSTNLVPSFHHTSGWRASLGWQCWERPQGFILRWTQLQASVTSSFDGTIATLGTDTDTGGVDVKRFRYHALEGLFYQTLVNCDDFYLNLLVVPTTHGL